MNQSDQRGLTLYNYNQSRALVIENFSTYAV